MTYQSTLLNLPGTKLAKLDRTDQSYDRVNNEYFFDRSPKMFEHILNYYRHGELHFPHCYCGPSIDNELHFWGLDENCISACCWRAYSAYEDEKKTVMELSKTLGEPSLVLNKEESGMSSKGSHANSEKLNNSLRFRVWRFLEKPQSSKQAKVGEHQLKVTLKRQPPASGNLNLCSGMSRGDATCHSVVSQNKL